jgi:hypothetical protein
MLWGEVSEKMSNVMKNFKGIKETVKFIRLDNAGERISILMLPHSAYHNLLGNSRENFVLAILNIAMLTGVILIISILNGAGFKKRCQRHRTQVMLQQLQLYQICQI